MSNETDLDWLARNVHKWHFFVDALAEVNNGAVKWQDPNLPKFDGLITRQQWLDRRAELQNKPSWESAQAQADFMAQEPHGVWTFFATQPFNPSQVNNDGWRFDGGFQVWSSDMRGEVLGDWRDTLERRPRDLSEQQVTARLTEATENVLAAASALMDEKFIIDRNDWFVRGELPPVGEFVDVEGEDLVYGDGELNCEVIAHVENTAVIRMSYGLGCFQKHVLSPSRTERDKAIDGMKQHCPYPGSWNSTWKKFAEALHEAGYRKDPK